ncbi:hypothetical protein [Halomonas sp.]|uniref:hypothetical protein n=1 Tax=Halomonas sp. TaxID=1486246 RepID=UPI00356521A2
MSAAMQRGDEVLAQIPWEGVVLGELVDHGPRCTIVTDGGEQFEVDESNVWKNGDGYMLTDLPPEEL